MGVSAELQAIAKFVFPDGVPKAFVSLNQLYNDCKKHEDVGGQDYRFSVAQSQGAAGSADYNTASTIAGNMQYTRFIVTPVTDYALARMNGEDWERLSADEGAVIDAWKDRIDGAVYEARRSLAIQMMRSGTGSRGKISAGSNVATNTITLADAAIGSSNIHNFYVAMQLQESATDGSALGAGTEVLAKLDRANGTLTSTSVTWATVLTNIAAGHFLIRRGDGQAGGSAKVITGLGAWLDGAATTLFSGDRSVDPVALSGTLFDGTSVPMAEAVLQLACQVSMEAEGDRVIYCHPRDKVQVVKLLESRARFFRPQQGAEATVGFDAIHFETDAGPMALKGDVNMPRQTAFLVVPNLVELNSVGKAPKILQKDGRTVRARDAYDSYEMRIGTYGLFCVRFAGACGQISNWGV